MGQFIKYYFNMEILGETLPTLVRAVGVVIELLVLSLTFAFVLGLLISLMRISRVRILRWLSAIYIDFIRGLPLLLLLTFIYYGLALVGSQTGLRILILGPIPAAVLGLSLCYAAYSAEIFRAGIQSIHKGQMEAARSLGMTYGQAMRFVVLPQAVRVVIPALTNELIAMIKDTALASVITTPEILFRAREIMGVKANPTPLSAAAIVYLVFTIPLIRVASRLETRQSRGKKARPKADAEMSADLLGQLPKG
ncbi:MAG: amino acid ABC transporter permease [Gaiellales bacterium]|nr:amino acid ABC transporter permease [Gaiellales bacterium]